MGRGKDKTISGTDIANMDARERQALSRRLQAGNSGVMGKVRGFGTAVVRSKATGNVRYDRPSDAGKFNEDKIQ